MSGGFETKFRKTGRNLNEMESVNSSKENIFKLKQKPKKNLRKKVESPEYDSLDSFKSLKGTEKLNNLDSRIKCLKLELMSMIGSTSQNTVFDEDKDVSDSLDLNFSTGEKKKRDVGSFISCHRAKSTDNPFSQVVTNSDYDSSTDLLDSKTKDSGVSSNKSVCGSQIKKSDTTLCNADGLKPSETLEPERLLYESFLIQNLGKYYSSSDESPTDLTKDLSRRSRKLKQKIKKTSAKRKRISHEHVKKYRSGKNFFDRSVEIISVGPSRSVSKPGQKLNNEIIDLDLENLDWNEPFELDENESLSNRMESDCEVICISPPTHTSHDGKEQINKNKVEKKNRWECPICFEQSTGQEIVTTLCGHVYCKQCLQTHLSTTTKTCPSCRTDLSGKSFVTLFNF